MGRKTRMPRKFWDDGDKLWNPITGWREYTTEQDRPSQRKEREIEPLE